MTKVSLVLLYLLAPLFVAPAAAQTPLSIKFVSPSTAGGGSDTLARLLGDQISRKQGRTVVVENRPGAGNIIGTEYVARSPPDGGTILITTPEFVINPHLKKVNYDPIAGFQSICYLVRSPQLIAVNSETPYRTFADFLEAARQSPGQLSIASAGPASSPHIAIETMKRILSLNLNFIPYQGSTPAVNAVLGGHITSVMASYPNVLELIQSNKLRALAVASASRIESLPDVPTLAENGLKDFEADIWFIAAAPSHTPKEVAAQLASWFSDALRDPEVAPKLDAQGLFPVGACAEEAASFVKKQYEDYGRMIKEADIR
ncbi:MAG: Bug family tripartite tricarboxylate transporter substrate binding protein [Xanthobacteraceae bacterium]